MFDGRKDQEGRIDQITKFPKLLDIPNIQLEPVKSCPVNSPYCPFAFPGAAALLPVLGSAFTKSQVEDAPGAS